MAELTDKGKARLERLKDVWPPEFVKVRRKYLLMEVEKNPDFFINPRSSLRPEWDKLVSQGLIIDTATESTVVVGGTERPLREVVEEFVKVTRPSDSEYRSGQIVPKLEFDEMVEAIEKEGGEPPLGEEV